MNKKLPFELSRDEQLIECDTCGYPFLTTIVFLTDKHKSHETTCEGCRFDERMCPECKRPMFKHYRPGTNKNEWVCVNTNRCDTARNQRKEAEDRLHEARKERFLASIPVEYTNTDVAQLPLPDAYRRVMKHDLTTGRGLIVRGDTGLGKTRAAYDLCIYAATKQGLTVKVYAGNEFTNASSAAYSDGGDGERWERSLLKPDVLFLDDLGKGVFTERVVNTLFAVVERRMSARKPIVITTNEILSSMIAKTRGDELTLRPIWRRLGEACDEIEFIRP